VYGVARLRRGEEPVSLGVVAWLYRVFDRAPRTGAPFRSAGDAQKWVAWQRTGWIMPAAVMCGLAVGLIMWALVSRDGGELVEGMFGGGAMLALVGFLGGLAMGNFGSHDGTTEMGNFLATRPMTTGELARTTLWTAARSVMLAWSIWAGAFLSVAAILWASYAGAALHMPEGVGWWYFPATLLGAWILAGGAATLVLAGHSALITKLICSLIFASVVTSLILPHVLTPAAVALVERGLAVGVAVAAMAGTAWAFGAARRRGMISWSTLAAALVAWAAGAAILALRWPLVPDQPSIAFVLLAGALALAVAPLGAAPLALAWNRHR
jgi:hypothetical protein